MSQGEILINEQTNDLSDVKEIRNIVWETGPTTLATVGTRDMWDRDIANEYRNSTVISEVATNTTDKRRSVEEDIEGDVGWVIVFADH